MADSVDLSQLAEAAAVIQTFEGETPPEEQVVVTIMPKATTPQISPAQVNDLTHALLTKSITKIAEAVRSIPALNTEIRRQNSQAVETNKQLPKPKRRPGRPAGSGRSAASTATGASNASEDPDAPFVVKQRQPRSTVAEPRRPWKPERLDTTKPILQCDACGYQANRRDYMRRHQIRVHSDYRPYQCIMCDFKTTEKHDLDRHMNSKYHGGKGITQKRQKLTATVKIKCDQCSYSTKSVKSILRHKELHKAERLRGEMTAEDCEAMDDGDAVEYMHEIDEDSQHVVQQDTEVLTDDAVAALMMNDIVNQ